jgi:hypothetical protein
MITLCGANGKRYYNATAKTQSAPTGTQPDPPVGSQDWRVFCRTTRRPDGPAFVTRRPTRVTLPRSRFRFRTSRAGRGVTPPGTPDSPGYPSPRSSSVTPTRGSRRGPGAGCSSTCAPSCRGRIASVRCSGCVTASSAVGWYRTHDRLHTGDPIAMATDALGYAAALHSAHGVTPRRGCSAVAPPDIGGHDRCERTPCGIGDQCQTRAR